MDNLDTFLNSLFKCVMENVVISNTIIRKHSRSLETLGDISFPIEIGSKKTVLSDAFLKHVNENKAEEYLIELSKTWPFKIMRCMNIKNNIHVFLNRSVAFDSTIKHVLATEHAYGNCEVNIAETIHVSVDCKSSILSHMNLSELRLLLLRNVAQNLLKFNNVKVLTDLPNKCDNCLVVTFTLKSNRKKEKNVILCGTVLNTKGFKDASTTAEDFYSKRTVDMRLMAEHKYGVRVTKEHGWNLFFEKLGEAAVIIELLQNKFSHSPVININDHTATSMKGASFILYNCARLATLFKEFEKKVSTNIYPALPNIDNVHFTLLSQAEEWELLYVYVLQFPSVIKLCINDILNNQINVHHLCSTLSGMCSVFSVYYRRVRILTEPRDHLYATLHARIYLLKAVQQVLHNGLHLLNIEPVKQM